MQANIQPYTIPATPGRSGGIAVLLSIGDDFTGQANVTAIFEWALLDSNGNELTHDKTPLTSDQYNNWGTGSDSTYIPSCIAANLGLTLA
jgi:hypothetical protein